MISFGIYHSYFFPSKSFIRRNICYCVIMLKMARITIKAIEFINKQIQKTQQKRHNEKMNDLEVLEKHFKNNKKKYVPFSLFKALSGRFCIMQITSNEPH